MYKFVIIVLFLCFLVPAAYSQEFDVIFHDTTIYGQPGDFMTIVGHAYNLSSTNPITLRMIRLQNNLPTQNWATLMCLGVCAPPTVDTLDWLVAAGDSAICDISFQSDLTTPGTATALIKFTTVGGSQSENQWFLGSTEINNINDQKDLITKKFELLNNYPNPFNNQTIISANIDKPAKVNLQIFDILGREVFNKNKEISSAGKITFRWNGLNSHGDELSSGIYFYRITANSNGYNNQSQIKKMTLLR